MDCWNPSALRANVANAFSFPLYPALWCLRQVAEASSDQSFQRCLKRLSRAHCINRPEIIKGIRPGLLRGNVAGLDASLDGSVTEVPSEEAMLGIIIAVFLKSRSNK